MKRPFGREQPYLGDLLTMVNNHLQITNWDDPLSRYEEAARAGSLKRIQYLTNHYPGGPKTII